MLRMLLVCVLVACGGGGSKQSASPPTATEPAVQLEIGELRLVDVAKDKAIVVRANGDIELDGVPAARVGRDGKIRNANGEVGFALQPDGSIVGPDGKPLADISLSSDAVIKSGDKSISLDPSGNLVGANPDAPQLRIEGATTPGLKRTALFVLIAITE